MIDLLLDLVEFAGNVSCVAIQDWGVSVGNLTGVVEDNDLGGEVCAAGSGLVLRVRGDISTLDVLDGHVLHVEADVVSGHSLGQGLVVHLDRLNLSGQLDWSEGAHNTGLDDAGLNTTHGHCSNTSNFVDILEGQTQGLVGGPLGGNDGVQGLQQGGAVGLTLLALNGPSLVPGHVLGLFQHVVSMPSRDGHEGNGGGVVANLLDASRHLLLDLLETSLRVWWLGRVHLVDTNDQLLDTKGISQEGVLTGLTVL